MKYIKNYKIFESKSDLISDCKLILMELEDMGLRVDVGYYSKELSIYITNKYNNEDDFVTFPPIKPFIYEKIKYNIEELISFLSNSFTIKSIHSISNYKPEIITLNKLEKLEYFERLEFRFKRIKNL